MTEHTYIYAWNWLYVMDYYKCMLRECGDRVINIYIYKTVGECVKIEYMYVCIYVYIYVCICIELKKGESW